jgi:hypothetical protein
MVPQGFRRSGLFPARLLAIGLGVLALTSVSCQSIPLLAPSGSTLTLIAAANELPANGSITITATVIEGTSTGTGTTTTTTGIGQPVHDGTEVTFTTTVGTIQPATAKTVNGTATVQLVGNGQSGQAKITAFSGAATSSATVAVGAAAAVRLVVTANPQSLPATGGSSTIVASVQDAAGVGLSGVAVGFSTTTGTFTAPTATTDLNGNATTTLSTVQAATVTASAAGTTGTGTTASPTGLTGTVAITLNPRTSITLTAPSTAAVVSTPTSIGVAVASSTTGVTPIITSMHVDFGDGSTQTFASLLSSVAHLYGASQVFTVTVTATDSTGGTSSGALQLPVGPLTASVTSQPGSIATGTAVSFTVAPSNAAASIDHYTWDFGTGEGPVQTTSSGTNVHTFTNSGSRTIIVTVFPTAGPSITVPIAITVT